MQCNHLHKIRYVHIISLWVACVLWGMILFYYFRYDLVPMISHKQLKPQPFFPFILSSFIPLFLVGLSLHFLRFIPCCIIICISAFLYGFSLLSFMAADFFWLPFSKICSALLLLLLVFRWIQKHEHQFNKTFSIFLIINFIFLLFDYFVCYPLYF